MKSKQTDYPISLLINRVLSEIDFVQDYYQLVFHEARLTVYSNNSKIKMDSLYFDQHTDLFFRSIISCINQVVINIHIDENDSIKLEFSNGYLLEISLKLEDYVGPEAAMFTDDDLKICDIW